MPRLALRQGSLFPVSGYFLMMVLRCAMGRDTNCVIAYFPSYSYYDLNCIRDERVQKFSLYLLVEVIKDNPPF